MASPVIGCNRLFALELSSYSATGSPFSCRLIFSLSMDGIELCDREFIAAIQQGREPNASVEQCLTAMQTLDRLERQLNG